MEATLSPFVYESLSHVSFSIQWTVAHKAPLSMGFPRQEYWSGLPCPIPGNLPDSGIEPTSPAVQVDSLPTEPPGKPIKIRNLYKKLSHIPQHAGEIIFILWGQGD